MKDDVAHCAIAILLLEDSYSCPKTLHPLNPLAGMIILLSKTQKTDCSTFLRTITSHDGNENSLTWLTNILSPMPD